MRFLALYLAAACLAAPALPPGPAVRVAPGAYKTGQTAADAIKTMSLPPGFQPRPFKAFKEGNRTWIWNEPENPPKSI